MIFFEKIDLLKESAIHFSEKVVRVLILLSPQIVNDSIEVMWKNAQIISKPRKSALRTEILRSLVKKLIKFTISESHRVVKHLGKGLPACFRHFSTNLQVFPER